MPVKTLSFSHVGPFEDVRFEFDDHINVLTGPNNSGKSTVLWVLGELLVYPFAIPRKLLRSTSARWTVESHSAAGVTTAESNFPSDVNQLRGIFESVGYTCFIPAHRHSTNYRSQGPTVVRDLATLVDEEMEQWVRELPQLVTLNMPETLRQFVLSSRSLDDPALVKRRNLMLSNSSLVSDEAVIQKIVDLDYGAYRKNKPGMRAIVNKVISIASEITEGYPLRFLGIEEDEEGLFPQLGTVDGNLPMNVLSQGTQSVIQWLARSLLGYAEYYDFPPDLEEMPGVLIIDEIDAHLHPSWQRRVLPTVTGHFPNLQVFCSTHSPMMLSGLGEGQIQLLHRSQDGRVTASTNEQDITGWTADEVLRNFLGVPDPTDWETVRDLERLRHLRSQENLTPEEAAELETLRQTVSRDLISGPVSAQIEQFAEVVRQINAPSSSPSGPPHGSRNTQAPESPSE